MRTSSLTPNHSFCLFSYYSNIIMSLLIKLRAFRVMWLCNICHYMVKQYIITTLLFFCNPSFFLNLIVVSLIFPNIPSTYYYFPLSSSNFFRVFHINHMAHIWSYQFIFFHRSVPTCTDCSIDLLYNFHMGLSFAMVLFPVAPYYVSVFPHFLLSQFIFICQSTSSHKSLRKRCRRYFLYLNMSENVLFCLLLDREFGECGRLWYPIYFPGAHSCYLIVSFVIFYLWT